MKRKGSKYLVAGAVSWMFDYGTLLLFYYVFNLEIGVATTTAFFIGLVVNFGLMKYWVFDDSPRHKQAAFFQGGLYIVLTGFNLLVTNIIVLLFSHKGIGPEISKIFATALIVCWNFILYRKFIFKEQTAKTPNGL